MKRGKHPGTTIAAFITHKTGLDVMVLADLRVLAPYLSHGKLGIKPLETRDWTHIQAESALLKDEPDNKRQQDDPA